MSIQPMKMFSFTWSPPPVLSEVRGQRTHVLVRFFPEEGRTSAILNHDGWGSGGNWDKAFECFQRNWKEVVLLGLE
jgi:hypothetical protein